MNPVPKENLADQVEAVLSDATPAVYQEVLKIAALRHPYRPKHVGLQNIFDQILHAGYAAAVFLPVLFWPSYWAAALGGFLLGGIREVEQYKNLDLMILMLKDRLQDALFFAAGAVLIYHLSR